MSINVNKAYSTIPWVLTVDFDQQYHLFHGIINTYYEIDAYSCTCGHIDFIIRKKLLNTDYECTECHNNLFYNANLAWSDFNKFISQNQKLILDCKYDTIEYTTNISQHINYVAFIPSDINFMESKIIYSKKTIY